MKVTGFDPLKPSGTAKRSGATTAPGGFSSLLGLSSADDVVPAAPLTDVAATASINNLLALQEISEEDVKRRKLMQQGQNMVEVLEKLRRQMLSGSIPPATLQELARNIKLQKQVVSDPALMAIINDIELRAAVELAKLEMAVASQSTID